MKSGSTRQHAEWRSLIEVSGPFLALEVLAEVFPQGLPAPETEKHVRARLRTAYAEWEAEFSEEGESSPAIHDAWVRFVLEDVLGFQGRELLRGQDLPASLVVPVAEHGETLKPDLAIAVEGKPRVLVAVWPKAQQLGRAPEDARWAASPAARMMTLLHATNTRLGLVTNGEAWMLVHTRPGETTTYATWWADVWRSEPLTLTAFRALLGRPAFFERPDDESLEVLFERSAAYAHEVTDQLGLQVRHAVELLVHALDKLDRTHQGTVLRGVDEKTLYESAVTVMMRLVFLLCAEERRLLLSGNDAWDTYYSPGTLREQLRAVADQQGEEVLERRQAAWARLLATFRAVYGGVRHSDFQLMAYGGSLFDPDRYPFLEGRKTGTSWKDTEAEPPAIDDRTVLNLLDSIQVLRLKGEPIRLSFRALDVEQIGHVYEGLLDHTAVRATTPVLGLGGKYEPEIPLDVLQREARKGREHFLGWLGEETGRSGAKTLERDAFEYALEDSEADRLHMVCEGETLYGEVERFAGLLRRDPNGYPVVYPAGARYVTQGSDRRSTGTHYTPRALTEPVVQYTLEPLVYVGPAEGKPRNEWKLKSTRELLSLRICDMAMGSGAFLVQACRYLAERVVESWGQRNQDVVGTPLFAPLGEESRGDPAELHLPKDPEERLILARRLVADRCIYGVDKNHMAVEMAKLSLWLTTLQKDRPFTFLDHALKPGDSLLGLTSLDQLEQFHILPEKGRTKILGSTEIRSWIKDAVATREKLERRQVIDIRDAEQKAWWHAAAEGKLAPLKVVADLLVSATLAAKPKQLDSRLSALAIESASSIALKTSQPEQKRRLAQLRQTVGSLLNEDREPQHAERRPFHWVLEFPEVFAKAEPGFDAIIGNPPFMGGKKISGALGAAYRNHLVTFVAHGKKGEAVDLVAYFFLRGFALIRQQGSLAFIATNTAAQGDTRESGIGQITDQGLQLYRAIASQPWPGTASLEICHTWGYKGNWAGERTLDGRPVQKITPLLTEQLAHTANDNSSADPFSLAENDNQSFVGSYVLGKGFFIPPEAALEIIKADARYAKVLLPFLGGEELNSSHSFSESRWVINFFDWPLNHETAPDDYEGPVAADFPRALAIIEKTVKPERQRQENGKFVLRNPLPTRWWQYADKRPGLYKAISGQKHVMVVTQTSRSIIPALVPNRFVIGHKVIVFSGENLARFAVHASDIHRAWVELRGSTMRTDPVYTPSDCYTTFPFPRPIQKLESIGKTYEQLRRQFLLSRKVGLTKLLQLLEQGDPDPQLEKLREAHVEMNQAVLEAYGWGDLLASHSFERSKKGVVYVIPQKTREEILERLLKLNHERHAEEVAAGLHEDGKAKGKSKAKSTGAKKPGRTQGKKSASKNLFEG
jgi:methylase of polypeptide subunit release factors